MRAAFLNEADFRQDLRRDMLDFSAAGGACALRTALVAECGFADEPLSPSRYTVQGRRKVLMLSVSAGAGHVPAAEALRAHANETRSGIEARHIDVMDYVPNSFRALYTECYLGLVKRHPALWGYLYRITNHARPDSAMQKLRRALERMNTRALMREIAAYQPDAIVCTHFLPAELLSYQRERIGCPVWVQVTDFDMHRMWVQPGIAGYFAANEEVAYRLRAAGIAHHAVHVTGIPLTSEFSRLPQAEECALELGFDPQRYIVLLMGGGAGVGGLDQVAARLLQAEPSVQLIVLAGRNVALLASLQRLARRHPGRLVAQGYTEQIERLMACADLAITKPGGLTSAECLAAGLPMIVHAPIPGQEERNADFLLEQGAALKACDLPTLEYRLGQLLHDPLKLREMRVKARALGRADAAQRVMDIVLGEGVHAIR